MLTYRPVTESSLDLAEPNLEVFAASLQAQSRAGQATLLFSSVVLSPALPQLCWKGFLSWMAWIDDDWGHWTQLMDVTEGAAGGTAEVQNGRDRSVEPKAAVAVNKEIQQQRVGGVSDTPDTLNSCLHCWQLV